MLGNYHMSEQGHTLVKAKKAYQATCAGHIPNSTHNLLLRLFYQHSTVPGLAPLLLGLDPGLLWLPPLDPPSEPEGARD